MNPREKLFVSSGVAAIVIALTINSAVAPITEWLEAREVRRAKTEAYNEATQNVVPKALLSPGSAKFSPFSESDVEIKGGGCFRVTGWVDSQNSYGALLRTRFLCKMLRGYKGWCEQKVRLFTDERPCVSSVWVGSPTYPQRYEDVVLKNRAEGFATLDTDFGDMTILWKWIPEADQQALLGRR